MEVFLCTITALHSFCIIVMCEKYYDESLWDLNDILYICIVLFFLPEIHLSIIKTYIPLVQYFQSILNLSKIIRYEILSKYFHQYLIH